MSKEKIQKRFVYEGLGFPVVFRNVPMVKVRGAWTPKVNYNDISKLVAIALAHKPSRLTGNEVRFLRHHFELTLVQFAERFAVTHPAVLKWEASEDDPTSMKWAVEKDIRLFVLDQTGVDPVLFAELYRALQKEAKIKGKPVELNLAA